jgi:hypothetical protein
MYLTRIKTSNEKIERMLIRHVYDSWHGFMTGPMKENTSRQYKMEETGLHMQYGMYLVVRRFHRLIAGKADFSFKGHNVINK